MSTIAHPFVSIKMHLFQTSSICCNPIWLKRFISAWHATIPLHHGIMAWHHGMDEGTNSWFLQNSRSKNPFCLKTYLGESSESDIQQIYITRPCLQFCRPPKIHGILSFWKFRISDLFGSGQYLAGKTCKPKIWNANFSKTKNSRKNGRPVELSTRPGYIDLAEYQPQSSHPDRF